MLKAGLHIYSEIERFQFIPKSSEGELRFHIIGECIPDLSSSKREALSIVVCSGPWNGNIISQGCEVVDRGLRVF